MFIHQRELFHERNSTPSNQNEHRACVLLCKRNANIVAVARDSAAQQMAGNPQKMGKMKRKKKSIIWFNVCSVVGLVVGTTTTVANTKNFVSLLPPAMVILYWLVTTPPSLSCIFICCCFAVIWCECVARSPFLLRRFSSVRLHLVWSGGGSTWYNYKWYIMFNFRFLLNRMDFVGAALVHSISCSVRWTASILRNCQLPIAK